MSSIRILPLLALAALAWPESAAACSVCYGGESESRTAFLLTTVLLSVLPPTLVGSLVWWIWRRTREMERGAPATATPSREPVRSTG